MSYAVSWSGGKDSCLACYEAMRKGYTVSCLMTLIRKNDRLTTSHYTKDKLIELQAEALGIPLAQKEITRYISTQVEYWLTKIFGSQSKLSINARDIIRNSIRYIKIRLRKITHMSVGILVNTVVGRYDREFKEAVENMASNGIKGMICGDIHFSGQREFVERICSELGLEIITPLAGQDKEKIMFDFINAGFEAIIVVVKSRLFGEEWIGRKLDRNFLNFLKENNIDPCGENGEYHTFVTNGPIFKKKIKITKARAVTKGEIRYLDALEYSMI